MSKRRERWLRIKIIPNNEAEWGVRSGGGAGSAGEGRRRGRRGEGRGSPPNHYASNNTPQRVCTHTTPTKPVFPQASQSVQSSHPQGMPPASGRHSVPTSWGGPKGDPRADSPRDRYRQGFLGFPHVLFSPHIKTPLLVANCCTCNNSVVHLQVMKGDMS